jgi:hypothetical protein
VTREDQPRVFITHSSHDQELAQRIVDALRLAVQVGEDQIFCSSIEGYAITPGRDFVQYIRDQLESTPLLVPLISRGYLDSEFCQWELGAAWVRRVDMVPVVIEPVQPSELRGPLQNRQAVHLDKAGLNNLASRIADCSD